MAQMTARWIAGQAAFARMMMRAMAVLVLTMVALTPVPSLAASIKGEANLTRQDGYARLILQFTEDVESDVKLSGQVLIVRFKNSVSIPVARLQEGAPDYVSTARQDPDGSALRIALARKLRVNSMIAGERLYIDFLPENWTGQLPGLPQDVVRELAERARNAERKLRQQRLDPEKQKPAMVRVQISNQPTFTRYAFDLSPDIVVTPDMGKERLTLNFDKAMTFDLSDAKANAPAGVPSIEQRGDAESSTLDFALAGEVEMNAFREEKSYVVDLRFAQKQKPKAEAKPDAKPDAKPEVKSETKPDAKSVAKSDDKSKPVDNIATPVAAPAAMPAAAPAPAAESPKAANAKPPSDKAAESTIQDVIQQPNAMVNVAAAKVESPPPAKPAPQKAEPAPQSKPVEANTNEPPAPNASAIDVLTERNGDRLELTFRFAGRTPAAIFRRGEALWLVFDSKIPLNLADLPSKGAQIIADSQQIKLPEGTALRLRLARPLLASFSPHRDEWKLALADTISSMPEPLLIQRNIVDPSRANISVPFDRPSRLHIVPDPDVGDNLQVVTALAPVRGFIKPQQFVDLQILHSMHGIAVVPNAEKIGVEIAPDRVLIGRPGGLTLSATLVSPDRAAIAVKTAFDPDDWRADSKAPFNERYEKLLKAATIAEDSKMVQARSRLARFYLAHKMYAEAKGVMDVVISGMKRGEENPESLVLRAVANILLNRPDDALADIQSPAVGNGYDSQLWKAMIYARQQKWADAREKFKNVEFAISSLPIDLQRIAITDAMRAALEVRDYESAGNRSNELDIVGSTPDSKPHILLLRARLAESLGRTADAYRDYGQVMDSGARMAAVDAEVRSIALKLTRNEMKPEDALDRLETLAVTWRGDDTEMRTLQLLFKLYSEAGRYKDALMAARTASDLAPGSDVTRDIQDAASALFASIYLDGKGAELSIVDTLTMFYEFRELTPIGRRGDELIRRLADRLAAADLLDQASELLQYQVDHRLQGAARAQVAARLAMLYLMNRKPDRALSALQTSRISNLSTELRQLRLLLEARAQSEVGRHELALDIIANVAGREAIRLRSDIYWAARQWREAAEQIELLYGERWKDDTALSKVEKSDILRAAIGYSLAEDKIGQMRFREKYASKMTTGEDAKSFAAAMRQGVDAVAEVSGLAKLAASFDTLEGFLRDMRNRYPEIHPKPAGDKPGGEKTPDNADAKGGSDKNTGEKNAGEKGAGEKEPATTGSLPQMPMRVIKLDKAGKASAAK